MKIDLPDSNTVKRLFGELDGLDPWAKAFKTVEIRNFFHNYYMEKIEIILAIAGEMQKHFREVK